MDHINWCTTLTPTTQALLRAQVAEIHKLNARFPRHTPMHTAWTARVEAMLAAQEVK
jgi:hypothetical protein